MQKRALKEDGIRIPALAPTRAYPLLLGGVLVCSLACGGPARADERGVQVPLDAPRASPIAGSSMPLTGSLTMPAPGVTVPLFDWGPPTLPEERAEPAAQFSPRKYFAPDQRFDPAPDRSGSLRTTTVWQRLNDYRSKDRVRLVTLWETSGSSISLQAGRHGEPSLQWTSRSMNRGGSTRGLLDHLVAASLGAAGIAVTQPGAPRGPASSPVTVRPVRAATVIAAAALGHAP